MSQTHDESEAIGTVTHYSTHLHVAAVELVGVLRKGDRIRIRGHTTDLVQTVESMEIAHQQVELADAGQDVALRVDDHVREHDVIYRE
ncbi:MAG TPA: hypothetical protein VIV06_05225 [Candidatus Limnocylindrales bacterium]